MELWVLSQDRERLTKIHDLRIYYAKQEDIWVIEDCDDLGYYKSKERALEILDEIQNILKPKLIVKCEGDESLPIITGEWANSIKEKMYYDIQNFPTYVYEMPKE